MSIVPFSRELNRASEAFSYQKYDLQEGIYGGVMQSLQQAGRVPLTFANVMRRYVELYDSRKAAKGEAQDPAFDALTKTYLDTTTGKASSGRIPSGERIKIVPHAAVLLAMTAETPLNEQFTLPLTAAQYQALPGEERSREELHKAGINRSLSRDEVSQVIAQGIVTYVHPAWLDLAEGDKSLAHDFASIIFAEGKQRHGYYTMMGVYLNEEGELSMRAWFLGRLEGGSVADDRNHLGNASARVLGVRELNASEASASRDVAVAAYMAKVQDAVRAVRSASIDNALTALQNLERIVQGQ